MYGNNTDNERAEIFFKFINEVASFSYSNIKTFEMFSKYDWLPKDTFKDLAYKVKIRFYEKSNNCKKILTHLDV